MSTEPSAVEQDARREEAVLRAVLELHPVTLSVFELIRLMGADMSDAIEGVEPWDRAVGELCRDGLLRLDSGSVFPTMAALRAYELFDQ